MIDDSKKCNRQLAFELQNSHVCEKHSKKTTYKFLICLFTNKNFFYQDNQLNIFHEQLLHCLKIWIDDRL